MKEKKKDFVRALEDLCRIYEDYAKKHDGSKIEVIIKDNMIKMWLYNNDYEEMDQFGLAFNHKEKDSYRYISIVLMKILFGSSVIYNKDEVLYNDKDKPYLKMYVNDDDVLSRMINMIIFYREIDFYDRIDHGMRVRNKINRMRNANNLEQRVGITRKLLRIRSMR